MSKTGSVVTWGRGEDGQLGHGDAESQDEPVVVQALEGEECDEIICGKGEQANAPIVAARW